VIKKRRLVTRWVTLVETSVDSEFETKIGKKVVIRMGALNIYTKKIFIHMGNYH